MAEEGTDSKNKRRQSYILKQLGSIDLRLQDLFDELGLNEDEKNHREKQLYSVIENALEEQVTAVSAERDDIVYKCQDYQYNLQVMVSALKDVDLESHEDTRGINELIRTDQDIPPPYKVKLTEFEKLNEQVEKIYSDRLMSINNLLETLKDLSTKVDDLVVPSELMPAQDDNPQNLDLSNSRIMALENEVNRWKNVYNDRIKIIGDYSTQIVGLWAELGTPQDDIDDSILSNYKHSPENLGTLTKDIERLKTIYTNLENEKTIRQNKINDYKQQIKHLWEKLNDTENDDSFFERKHVGLTTSTIDAYEAELNRLLEKKRQYIHIFINDARENLKELWKKLYFSEEEMYKFTPAWNEVYTDASLDAHEQEIERLNQVIEERKPVLKLIDEYYKLEQEAEELEASTHDSSRLLATKGGKKRDPSRLLREEQMRKRITKRRPKIINELKTMVNNWEEKNSSQPFMVNGERFLDTLNDNNKSSNNVPNTPASAIRRVKSTNSNNTNNHTSTNTNNRSVSASAIRNNKNTATSQQQQHQRPGAISTSPVKSTQRKILSPTKEQPTEQNLQKQKPTTATTPAMKKLNITNNTNNNELKYFSNPTATRLKYHNNGLSPVKPRPDATHNNRIPSNTSSDSTKSSENWEVYDDSDSSDDEIVDGSYMRWRQEAMKNLGNQDYQVRRVSEFNWDKDVF